MDTQAIIENLPNQVYGSPSGIKSVFVPLSDTVGIKLYQDVYDRNLCYYRQDEAAELELAPDTYGVVDDLSIEGVLSNQQDAKFTCGYLTEIVETIYSRKYDDKMSCVEILESLYYPDKGAELVQELREASILDFSDNHIENVGIKQFDGEWKLVCIDFGDE